jgi:phosphatidylserine decarboxylase
MRIAREAWPFAAPLIAAAVAGGFLLHPLVFAAFLPPILFTLWFFRDPERTPPTSSGVLVCPADGRIIRAGPGAVSVFMNVFNVHVCRSPVAGTVDGVEHFSGRFLAAFKDSASEQNERMSIGIAAGGGRVRFVLVAGLVARRIVCKVERGRRLAAGERVGLIRFGSRVDVDLPPGSRILVTMGEKVVAGETVLAQLPESWDESRAGEA